MKDHTDMFPDETPIPEEKPKPKRTRKKQVKKPTGPEATVDRKVVEQKPPSPKGSNPEEKPTSLIAAIARCMQDMRKLDKSNVNKFDNYKFTSVDDFLDGTRPTLAKYGIVVLTEEAVCEHITREDNVKGQRVPRPWLHFVFKFTLLGYGETLGPFTRTVFVRFSGAQSSGSAQSYALKQFLRSQFLIATGDQDDPDLEAKDDTSTVQVETITPLEHQKVLGQLDSLGLSESDFCGKFRLKEGIAGLEKHRFPKLNEWLEAEIAKLKPDEAIEAELEKELQDALGKEPPY